MVCYGISGVVNYHQYLHLHCVIIVLVLISLLYIYPFCAGCPDITCRTFLKLDEVPMTP